MIVHLDAQGTYPLRQAVLRPGLPPKSCEYDGDWDPGSFHLGFQKNGAIIGVASFFKEPHPLFEGRPSYRLRGMATDTRHQSKGIGSLLLQEGLVACRERGAALVWCNARSQALTFYRRLGFVVVSEEFTIEGIGPHHVMQSTLDSRETLETSKPPQR